MIRQIVKIAANAANILQGCIEIVSYRNSVGLLPIHHCIEIVSHRNSVRKCRLFCEKLVRIEIVSRHYFDAPL